MEKRSLGLPDSAIQRPGSRKGSWKGSDAEKQAVERAATPRKEQRENISPKRATVVFHDPQHLLPTARKHNPEEDPVSGNDTEASYGFRTRRSRRHSEPPMNMAPAPLRTPRMSPGMSPRASLGGTPLKSPRLAEGGDYITVSVRVRPLLQRDFGQRDTLLAHADCQSITLVPEASTSLDTTGGSSMPLGRGHNEPSRTYKFDHVFDSRTDAEDPALQHHIFESVGNQIVKSTVAGYNACLFAYGQTGTGKTHTLMGLANAGWRGQIEEKRGLLPRILDGIFSQVRLNLAAGKISSLRISYIEIYNEKIRDLLVPPNSRKNALMVRYTPALGLVIHDLTESVATTREEAQELVDFGLKMRSIASTSMNSRSSRAHTVFMFNFEQSEGGGEAVLSRVQLVDLAGREQEKSGDSNFGDSSKRLRERAFINTSLFHLSSCISHLARSGSGNRRVNEWVFRNSRLTMLLADSLAGNSRTAMVAAVSPAASDIEETLSTLRFAAAAKTIKTEARYNHFNKRSIVEQLHAEIARLKEDKKQDYELLERTQQLEVLCEHYKQSLENEQCRSADSAAVRAKALEELGLSVGSEGTAIAVGAGQSVPYLVNMSEDPCLEGCLMYFLKGPEEVTIGSTEGNTIRVVGLGVWPQHCIIQNLRNRQLFLRPATGPEDGGACSPSCSSSSLGFPRAFVNGRRVTGYDPVELHHSDCLVLGYSYAFRIAIPLEATRRSRGATASGNDLEDTLKPALAEIMDPSSLEFEHLRKSFEDFKHQSMSEELTNAFATELYHAVPDVEKANMIAREVQPGECLEFKLQVLSDLGVSSSSMPELAVAVLRVEHAPAASSPSSTPNGLQRQHSSPQDGRKVLKFIWSFEKFRGRLQLMCDIYAEVQEMGLSEVLQRIAAEPYSDPWKEIGSSEAQMLLDGVSANQIRACLAHEGLPEGLPHGLSECEVASPSGSCRAMSRSSSRAAIPSWACTERPPNHHPGARRSGSKESRMGTLRSGGNEMRVGTPRSSSKEVHMGTPFSSLRPSPRVSFSRMDNLLQQSQQLLKDGEATLHSPQGFPSDGDDDCNIEEEDEEHLSLHHARKLELLERDVWVGMQRLKRWCHFGRQKRRSRDRSKRERTSAVVRSLSAPSEASAAVTLSSRSTSFGSLDELSETLSTVRPASWLDHGSDGCDHGELEELRQREIKATVALAAERRQREATEQHVADLEMRLAGAYESSPPELDAERRRREVAEQRVAELEAELAKVRESPPMTSRPQDRAAGADASRPQAPCWNERQEHLDVWAKQIDDKAVALQNLQAQLMHFRSRG